MVCLYMSSLWAALCVEHAAFSRGAVGTSVSWWGGCSERTCRQSGSTRNRTCSLQRETSRCSLLQGPHGGNFFTVIFEIILTCTGILCSWLARLVWAPQLSVAGIFLFVCIFLSFVVRFIFHILFCFIISEPSLGAERGQYDTARDKGHARGAAGYS